MDFKRYLNVIRTKQNIPTHVSSGDMIFYCPTFMEMWRVDTLYTKEPETIAWIDSFPKNSTLWDIGANVGMYTIYAAKKGHFVVAFEPSSREFQILQKNIVLNHVWGRSENIFFDEQTDVILYPRPEYIKIDTDGNDVKILKTLEDKKTLALVKEVSIEVEPATMRAVTEIMNRNNLFLKSKSHSEMMNGTPYEIYDNAIFERRLV